MDFFPPVDFPAVEHIPWVKKNIPIPPGLFEEVCRIVRTKLDAGIYEPSNSSYRSHWFCILKKDGKSLRPVHSLEPLNKVTIQHSGIIPMVLSAYRPLLCDNENSTSSFVPNSYSSSQNVPFDEDIKSTRAIYIILKTDQVFFLQILNLARSRVVS
jgi:hypothetical protein